MSQGVVLFTASKRSRQKIEGLASEARRLRPDVEIIIRSPDGAVRAVTKRGGPRQLELDLELEPPSGVDR